MRRRNTELGLLVLVVCITAGAYVLATLGLDSEIPVDIGPFLLVVCGLLLFANLITRRTAPQGDPILLPVAGLLNGIGYVMIARIDQDLAALQAVWSLIGLAAFAATLAVVRHTRDLAAYRWTIGLVGLALIALPFTPFGQEINGARIWVQIGPVNFQPGEFAKLALACFFAAYLVEKRELLALGSWGIGRLRIPDPKHLGPVLVAWGVSLAVMAYQTDLGSALLFFTLFLVMLWVATQRASYLVVGFTLFALGSYAAWTQFGHIRQRLRIWLDPWADVQDEGFQIAQAAFAMADGGLTGTGLGLSGRVAIPFAETDFIFAVIAQELGLAGAAVVLMSYVLLVGSGLRVAIRAADPFDKLLATGLSTLLGVQAFVIIAGVTRLLPLTGITLPFVSYGGSSLISNYILIALLLRISDENAPERLAAKTTAREVAP
ncbi:MAG: FtsW/RodA/SpoVE family cell cycle protein [Acidimicrobiia bacterium]|nr:FtsW/RodA/SpoVE family cell cycle protein [Acidimicrobiia bacterium]